jgi:hypothetical protein
MRRRLVAVPPVARGPSSTPWQCAHALIVLAMLAWLWSPARSGSRWTLVVEPALVRVKLEALRADGAPVR